MRVLVIFSHPSSESFGASVFEMACRSLKAAGHEVRMHDLYQEKFQPILTKEEWDDYLSNTDQIIAKHSDHVDDLQWAEALVVIYPTWFYGAPAMLKGWLERVWLPGVAFEVADAKQKRPKPKMRNIRYLVGITSSGSPWWWFQIIGDPGRKLWTRGLRALFAPGCKVVWRQIYNMNHSSNADRVKFLKRVERTLKRIR